MSSLKPHPKLDLPQCMIDGEKFVKWDEDTMVGTPVTLKIDKYGFYVSWLDQNSESDVLDLAVLRDVRTGKYAKIPKDPKLRQLVNIGSPTDALEEKTVTMVYGTDFVNLSFTNFCCAKKELAKLWTDELMKLICNRVQANASALTFLLKAYTKLTLLLDRTGKIPVKNILKMFTQNKEERKRIEKALDCSGQASGKNEALSPSAFSFEDFLTFYKNLTQRMEVERIFDELCESGADKAKHKFMNINQFVDFINTTQRDPRLNEILHPYANVSRAKDLIEVYEPNQYNALRGQLSIDGFMRYLMSDDNPIMNSSKLDLSEDDMDQPLAHYFINSSHNTYLSGHQLTGKSSVEMYRQCLLAGCRCVELDFWNGKTDEPVIVHGYTFVPEIPARDVLEAIAESAFKTSDYPVILSFENHCNPRQQAKIAQYCHEFFGDMLLDTPLETHKLEPGSTLPPPSILRRKIIIKNKKKHHHHHHNRGHKKNAANAAPTASSTSSAATTATATTTTSTSITSAGNGSVTTATVTNTSSTESEAAATSANSSPKNSIGNGDVKLHPSPVRQGSKDSSQDNEDDDDEDDGSSTGIEDEDDESTGAEDIKLQMQSKPTTDKVSSRKETEAGAEISALVNYVQPVHFVSFDMAKKKSRCYEMSSFDEKQAATQLKERPIEFVDYNKNQLSRVYPGGTRFDSSNFIPQVFWNVGCQLVALNYQTLDLAMQLNLGMFEYNGRCGYLLKPEFLRRSDRWFDPFAESTVDGIIAGTVSIHVLSGQLLSDKRVGTYVEVDMFGLPADTVRKKFRTKCVPNNGINPVYDDEPFAFKKVVLPDLASIRIAAYEESGKLIGHRVLPVIGLCPGYRQVGLRNEAGQPLPLATLFLFVIVKDYVPDCYSELAEALSNPIKFYSEKEIRAEKLKVFDDLAGNTDAGTSDAPAAKQPKGSLPEIRPPPFAGLKRPSIPTPSVVPLSSLSIEQSEIVGRAKMTELSAAVPLTSFPSLNEVDLKVETLEKFMEHKPVKEKKAELEKKLEKLKLEKDKNKVHIIKQESEAEKSRSKFHIGLVKRLSVKSIENIVSSLSHMTHEVPEKTDVADSEQTVVSIPCRKLTQSQSERLIQLTKEYYHQEKELKEKYHEMIFNAVEKIMRTSQSNQLKTLRSLLEKETDLVMRRLEASRREEIKSLSKAHTDKDEITRRKREVASSTVDKGVNERMRLTQIYDKQKEELERHHQEVRQRVEEERARSKLAIAHEYEEKLKSLPDELKCIPEGDENQRKGAA